MAKIDNRVNTKQPAQVSKSPEVSSVEPAETNVPAPAAVDEPAVEPQSDSFASVTPVVADGGLIELHEAATRYIEDRRFNDGWKVGVQRHANSLGHGGKATAEDWLKVFKSFGLKVKE